MSNEPLESLRPPDRLKIHNIGFLVHSIHESTDSFALSLAATWGGNVVLIRCKRSG